MRFLVLLPVTILTVAASEEPNEKHGVRRELQTLVRGPYFPGDTQPPVNGRSYEITMTNLAYSQPMGPAFVTVHNGAATPVFQAGAPAGSGLEVLAEEGDPSQLVAEYANAGGVLSAVAEGSAPIFAGESRTFTVTVTDEYPYFSMATMLVNTNDCFAGVSMMMPEDDMVVSAPGYDSGTEANDESCAHVPGPACAGLQDNDGLDPDGEGVVHIHRGVHGIGDLDASLYDWRNPVMRVHIREV